MIFGIRICVHNSCICGKSKRYDMNIIYTIYIRIPSNSNPLLFVLASMRNVCAKTRSEHSFRTYGFEKPEYGLKLFNKTLFVYLQYSTVPANDIVWSVTYWIELVRVTKMSVNPKIFNDYNTISTQLYVVIINVYVTKK